VKFGVALGALNAHFHLEATLAAESLGFESVWLPEHLVFTRAMSRSPHPGEEHPPVPPDTPIYDAFAYLAFLAARTERVRLGTHVFNIGLRHPFTTARGVQTLDLLSNGRFEFGIGASWLEEEWNATQLDFASRGRRVDEAVEVCKRLWSEETISHKGEFFAFDEVVFEPKAVQKPWPPILVGGESKAALRRAARLGDGWIGMAHRRAVPDGARGADRIGGGREAVGGDRRDAHDRVTVAPVAGSRRSDAALRRRLHQLLTSLASRRSGSRAKSRIEPTCRSATFTMPGCIV
jgi:probable F420-dependent oxidoreductase